MKTTSGQKAQMLAALNPWWRDALRWQQADKDLIEVRQSSLGYNSGILNGLHAGALYSLRGPRRVGKTVAVKQSISQLLADGVPPQSIVRVAMDDMSVNDLRTLVQNIALPPMPDGATRYWFIDEVTSVSGDWARQVKWLRDNDEEFAAATVVLTGSNAAAITEATGLLAGRRGRGDRLDRVLLPLGFRSFADLLTAEEGEPLAAAALTSVGDLGLANLHTAAAKDAYGAMLPWIGRLDRLWGYYLQYGGFPRAAASAKRGEPVERQFIDDLFAVVFKDAFGASRMDIGTETALLERLWQGMAAPLNISSIAADIGISDTAVRQHVAYLRDAFLLWLCPQKQDSGWLARGKSQAKAYAIDPLIARLPYLRNPSRQDIDPTVLSEMQLGAALWRRVACDDPQAESDSFLFHLRTPARKEIDFVSEHLGGAAIESNFVEDGRWRRHAATVNASQWQGLVATRNVLDTTEAESAWAVPASFIAYLIDT